MLHLLNRDLTRGYTELLNKKPLKSKKVTLKVVNDAGFVWFQTNCKLDTFTLKKPPGETNAFKFSPYIYLYIYIYIYTYIYYIYIIIITIIIIIIMIIIILQLSLVTKTVLDALSQVNRAV